MYGRKRLPAVMMKSLKRKNNYRVIDICIFLLMYFLRLLRYMKDKCQILMHA